MHNFKPASFYKEIAPGFEWFYFDLHGEEYDLVITFHRRVFNLAFDISLLDVFVYHKNAQVFHKYWIFNDKQVSISDDTMHIKFPQGEISEKDGRYFIIIQSEEIELDLKISRGSEKWIPARYDLMKNIGLDGEFYWSVWVPKAAFQCKLKFNSVSANLKGIAYHDHNWGNALFPKVLNGWKWGKYLTENGIIIYGVLDYKNGKQNKIALTVDHKYSEVIENTTESVSKDETIEIQFSDQTVKIKESDKNIIENVTFNINTLPRPLGFFRKLTDFVLVHLQNIRYTGGIYYKMANTTYTRYKAGFILNESPHPLSFHETMKFK